MQLVHRRLNRLPATTFAELVQTALRKAMGRELGAQVAAALVGVAHARDEPGQHVVVEARRRDHDTFLVERPRLGGEAARLGGTDVGMVRACDRKARRACG